MDSEERWKAQDIWATMYPDYELTAEDRAFFDSFDDLAELHDHALGLFCIMELAQLAMNPKPKTTAGTSSKRPAQWTSEDIAEAQSHGLKVFRYWHDPITGIDHVAPNADHVVPDANSLAPYKDA